MSTFVLDCSIAISWLFKDEASPENDGLLEQLQNGRALVPSSGIWNSAMNCCRLNGVAELRSPNLRHHDFIGRLPIDFDTETESRASREIFTRSRTETLTTYDAAYLEVS